MLDKYCSGCGARLQIDDETKDGYVDPKALNRDVILCKRCFQLKHYGKFKTGTETYSTIKMIHENVSLNDVLILVCDVSLTLTPILSHLQELNRYKNFYLIAIRYDLYKDYLKEEKALDFLVKNIKDANLKVSKIYLLNNNLEAIFEDLNNLHKDANLCFVGLENAGKTTLINRYLSIYYPNIPLLTKSLYPGTTLQPFKIQLTDTRYLMDTPGIKSNHSMLNKIETSVLKKLQLDKKITATSYQLFKNQAIIINNFLVFEYLEGVKQTFVFYSSSMCDLNRVKLENVNKSFDSLLKDYTLKTNKIKSFKDLTCYDIIINKKTKKDIVIEGFASITVTKPGKFKIYTLKDLNVFVRDSMI